MNLKITDSLHFQASKVLIFFYCRNKYQREGILDISVVNCNQTQLITVNVVFLKSFAIAVEVETEYIVLTFDLVFYVKAQ